MSEIEKTYLLIGNKLRSIRKNNKVSLSKLARTTGINRGYISKIEKGKANPTILTIGTLCKTFDISLIEFLKSNDAKNI